MVLTRAGARTRSTDFSDDGHQGPSRPQTTKNPAMEEDQGMCSIPGHEEDFPSLEDHEDTSPEDYGDDDRDQDYQPHAESEAEPEPESKRQKPMFRLIKPQLPPRNALIPRDPNTAHSYPEDETEAYLENHQWKLTLPKRKKYVFIIPVPTSGELKTLLANFTRPSAKRNGWGYSRNAGDAVEELWAGTYGWDLSAIRIEMDYGLLIRNLGQFRAHQQVNGKNCDRCFANGRSSPCDHDFHNACTPCMKHGVICTYTDRRTLRTRDLTGDKNRAAENVNDGATLKMWHRCDQPPVEESVYIHPAVVKDTKPRPEPQVWREQDAELNTYKQRFGHDPHVNPVPYDNQTDDPDHFPLGQKQHVNDEIHRFRSRGAPARRLLTHRGGEPSRKSRMRKLNLGGSTGGQANPDAFASTQNIRQSGGFQAQQQYGSQQTNGQGMGSGQYYINNAARGQQNPNQRTVTLEQMEINALYQDRDSMHNQIETLVAQNQYFFEMFERLEGILPHFVLDRPFPVLRPRIRRPNPFLGRLSVPTSFPTAGAQLPSPAGPQRAYQNVPQSAPSTTPQQPFSQLRSPRMPSQQSHTSFRGSVHTQQHSYPASAQQASFPTSIQTPQQVTFAVSAPPHRTTFSASAHTPRQASFQDSVQSSHQGHVQGQQSSVPIAQSASGAMEPPSRPPSFDPTVLQKFANPDYELAPSFLSELQDEGFPTLPDFLQHADEHQQGQQQAQAHLPRRMSSGTMDPSQLMNAPMNHPQPHSQPEDHAQGKPASGTTLGDKVAQGIFPGPSQSAQGVSTTAKRSFDSVDPSSQSSEPTAKRPRHDSTPTPGPTPQGQPQAQRSTSAALKQRQSTMGPTAMEELMAAPKSFEQAGWTPAHGAAATRSAQQMANENVNADQDHKHIPSDAVDSTDAVADGDANEDMDAPGDTDSLFGSVLEHGAHDQPSTSRQTSDSNESIEAFHYPGGAPVA